jgi:hypothetical protein
MSGWASKSLLRQCVGGVGPKAGSSGFDLSRRFSLCSELRVT